MAAALALWLLLAAAFAEAQEETTRPAGAAGTGARVVEEGGAQAHSGRPAVRQKAFTAAQYYPGRDGAALAGGALDYHDGDSALQNRAYNLVGAELIVACASGDLEKLKHLLADGADPNFVHDASMRPGRKGRLTPLLQAIENNALDVVRMLLHAGANATRPERNGDTALLVAVKSGQLDIAKALLDHGVSADHRHGQSGQAALHAAARHGHSDIVRLLCDAGAEPGVKQHEVKHGATALHLAAKYNHLATVEVLLDHCRAHASLQERWRDATGKVGTPHAFAASRTIGAALARGASEERGASPNAAAASDIERHDKEKELR